MFNLPTHCPACNNKLRWTNTKTDLWCSNTNCSGKHGQRITAFFKLLRCDGVSTETVADFIEAGFTTISKIVKNATAKKLMRLEGYQATKAKKVSEAVQNCLRDVPLARVMHASGIFQDEMTSMGSTRLQDFISCVGEGMIERGKANDIRMRLTKLKGAGPRLINLFVDNLSEWRKFYDEIKDVYSPPSGPKTLKGVKACWTGFRDPKAEEFLVKHGGQVAGGVSKTLTVLFAASTSSGKAVKADSYGVLIVPQNQMWTWLKEKAGAKK